MKTLLGMQPPSLEPEDQRMRVFWSIWDDVTVEWWEMRHDDLYPEDEVTR